MGGGPNSRSPTFPSGSRHTIKNSPFHQGWQAVVCNPKRLNVEANCCNSTSIFQHPTSDLDTVNRYRTTRQHRRMSREGHLCAHGRQKSVLSTLVVGMWESRRLVARFARHSRKEGEAAFGFPRFPQARHLQSSLTSRWSLADVHCSGSR